MLSVLNFNIFLASLPQFPIHFLADLDSLVFSVEDIMYCLLSKYLFLLIPLPMNIHTLVYLVVLTLP